ncbi:hypothetical protein FA13DRAFT_1794642 [Coprinellus micaceus]|uniref:Uncharacterized protein n=1 Tax=Coprinellus micaceus TaxID=71717 RepID=A0A4Y7T112_COPMI|nr:hypothetical protein FA13DRAFT_1794642 [Coprinellus micaceus]
MSVPASPWKSVGHRAEALGDVLRCMHQALNTLVANNPKAWGGLPSLYANSREPTKVTTVRFLLKLRHDIDISNDAVIACMEEYAPQPLCSSPTPVISIPPSFPRLKFAGTLETLEVDCYIGPTEDLLSMTLVTLTTAKSLGVNNLNPLIFSMHLKPSTPCQTQLILNSLWEIEPEKSSFHLKMTHNIHDADTGRPTIVTSRDEFLTSTTISMPRMCPAFPPAALSFTLPLTPTTFRANALIGTLLTDVAAIGTVHIRVHFNTLLFNPMEYRPKPKAEIVSARTEPLYGNHLVLRQHATCSRSSRTFSPYRRTQKLLLKSELCYNQFTGHLECDNGTPRSGTSSGESNVMPRIDVPYPTESKLSTPQIRVTSSHPIDHPGLYEPSSSDDIHLCPSWRRGSEGSQETGPVAVNDNSGHSSSAPPDGCITPNALQDGLQTPIEHREDHSESTLPHAS